MSVEISATSENRTEVLLETFFDLKSRKYDCRQCVGFLESVESILVITLPFRPIERIHWQSEVRNLMDWSDDDLKRVVDSLEQEK